LLQNDGRVVAVGIRGRGRRMGGRGRGRRGSTLG